MIRAGIIQANALAIPMASNSVDLVVTSPPYWALRIPWRYALGCIDQLPRRRRALRRPARQDQPQLYHLDGWVAPVTRPGVVLDPFVGTGTSVGVARALGRLGVGLDLSFDYARLSRWRVFESGHFSKTVDRTNAERQGSLL